MGSVTPHTGNSATESSFKREASSADIIHVSTHGFFNEDKEHEHSSAMHNSGLFLQMQMQPGRMTLSPSPFKRDMKMVS